MKNKKESDPKKGDLNFKKWLLSLSSIGNLILGGLLFIMGISAMRFHLDKILIAEKEVKKHNEENIKEEKEE